MSIIYCPVCGMNIKYSNACQRCGYEKDKDYEVYPTISMIEGNIKSIEIRYEQYLRDEFQVNFNECLNSVILSNTEETEIGETLFFGAYKQDKKSKEKKAIEWIVLDKKEGMLLLISKYALDCKPYNDEYEETTWEKCTLRGWLNSSFIEEAFNSQEETRIIESKINAAKNSLYDINPGNDTRDKVFLLSIDEVEKYFPTDESRQCKPTEYAIENNTYVDDKDNCWWWLRSPGYLDSNAAGVFNDGFVCSRGNIVDYCRDAVRPALWISL